MLWPEDDVINKNIKNSTDKFNNCKLDIKLEFKSDIQSALELNTELELDQLDDITRLLAYCLYNWY